MRFMNLVIPKAYETATADFVAKMTKYNDSLSKAGVLVSLDGLAPPTKAARVSFSGGKTLDEAVEWARRAPMLDGDIIEVQQIPSMDDFPADVQAAARGPHNS